MALLIAIILAAVLLGALALIVSLHRVIDAPRMEELEEQNRVLLGERRRPWKTPKKDPADYWKRGEQFHE